MFSYYLLNLIIIVYLCINYTNKTLEIYFYRLNKFTFINLVT